MKNGILTRIVIFLLFTLLFISMLISLTGFHGPIQFDDSYYSFLQKVALDTNSWKFSIPEIPKIPLSEEVGTGWDIVRILTNIVNFLVIILNVIVTLLNFIIELVMFIGALIKNIYQFVDSGFADSGALSYWS